MSGEFAVNPETLASTSQAVRDAVGELAAVGGMPPEIVAASGLGLTEIGSTDVGHDGLSTALAEFGNAWDYAVRNLVHDGTSAAEQLEAAAQSYREMDQDAAAELRKIPGGDDG